MQVNDLIAALQQFDGTLDVHFAYASDGRKIAPEAASVRQGYLNYNSVLSAFTLVAQEDEGDLDAPHQPVVVLE